MNTSTINIMWLSTGAWEHYNEVIDFTPDAIMEYIRRTGPLGPILRGYDLYADPTAGSNLNWLDVLNTAQNSIMEYRNGR